MRLEVDIMARIAGHENVCTMHASGETKTSFVIVMEVANGGDLMSRVERYLEIGSDVHFSESVASNYVRQMLEAIKHCHMNLVIHR